VSLLGLASPRGQIPQRAAHATRHDHDVGGGLLPGNDAAEALVVAEAVIGVASDVIVDTDLAGLFRRADAALYIAKRAGRDQVALLESDDDSVLHPSSTVRKSVTRVWHAVIG
jgi:predicted signal transduction protein with EAL and GGDEF domain